MEILDDIYGATVKGSYKDIEELVKSAVDGGEHPNDIVNKALSPAMIEVGDKFGTGELYMPDMLLSAKAMQTAMGILKPLLKADESLKPALRQHGLLTRDSRVKERKKAGLKRARKAPQYTKR